MKSDPNEMDIAIDEAMQSITDLTYKMRQDAEEERKKQEELNKLPFILKPDRLGYAQQRDEKLYILRLASCGNMITILLRLLETHATKFKMCEQEHKTMVLLSPHKFEKAAEYISSELNHTDWSVIEEIDRVSQQHQCFIFSFSCPNAAVMFKLMFADI